MFVKICSSVLFPIYITSAFNLLFICLYVYMFVMFIGFRYEFCVTFNLYVYMFILSTFKFKDTSSEDTYRRKDEIQTDEIQVGGS